MAYLVRKLIKQENVKTIGLTTNFGDMLADIVTSEFRTKKGTLSTWRIETINEVNINNAILAIAVSSTKIERMDFIIINTDYLDHQRIEYKKTYAGRDIAVPDLQDTHYDICNITNSKLLNCLYVYQRIWEEDKDFNKYIIRKAQGAIQDIISSAKQEKRIDITKLSKEIREQMSYDIVLE